MTDEAGKWWIGLGRELEDDIESLEEWKKLTNSNYYSNYFWLKLKPRVGSEPTA